MIIAGVLTLATNMFLAPPEKNEGAKNDMIDENGLHIVVDEHLEEILSSNEPVDLHIENDDNEKFDAFLEEKSERMVENSKKHAIDEIKRNDKTGFDYVYKAASDQYGIPWEILSAVHFVETGRRGNTTIGSYAGAIGPMQFLPSTFRRFGVDGDGDGRALINDSDDAIFSAANYLRASGGTKNIRTGLYTYNHSTAYVNKVLGVARSLGYTG